MGIGLDELTKRMYQHRSTGDWQEFGDEAKKLHWVDEIVSVVHEESYVKNPDTVAARPTVPAPLRLQQDDALTQEIDPQGHAFTKLPRLSPVDAYYLYNPDNYYRLGQ